MEKQVDVIINSYTGESTDHLSGKAAVVTVVKAGNPENREIQSILSGEFTTEIIADILHAGLLGLVNEMKIFNREPREIIAIVSDITTNVLDKSFSQEEISRGLVNKSIKQSLEQSITEEIDI